MFQQKQPLGFILQMGWIEESEQFHRQVMILVGLSYKLKPPPEWWGSKRMLICAFVVWLP